MIILPSPAKNLCRQCALVCTAAQARLATAVGNRGRSPPGNGWRSSFCRTSAPPFSRCGPLARLVHS